MQHQNNQEVSPLAESIHKMNCIVDMTDTDTDNAPRGAKAQYKCHCGVVFTARVADRNRGWARNCSKRCKAIKQERQTGQHRAYINHNDGGLCFPSHAEGAFND